MSTEITISDQSKMSLEDRSQELTNKIIYTRPITPERIAIYQEEIEEINIKIANL